MYGRNRCGVVWPEPDPDRQYRQVINADNPTADVTPADPSAAEAVQAGWAALQPGQSVPLLGERVWVDLLPDECACRGGSCGRLRNCGGC